MKEGDLKQTCEVEQRILVETWDPFGVLFFKYNV